MGFDPQSIERISRVVRDKEFQPRRYDGASTPIPPVLPCMVFRVTTQISGGSVSNPGTGGGIRQDYTSSGWVDMVGFDPETLKTMNEKTIKVGAIVYCSPAYGLYWVEVVDKCSNLI